MDVNPPTPDGFPGNGTPELLMTPREVAALLGVHPRTLALYAKTGKIHFVKTLAGHRRFPVDTVRAACEGRWEDAAPRKDADDPE